MVARKINMFITDQQSEALEKLKEKTGIKLSEAVRRAIDEYLKRELEEK